jgi:hypothetical protein
MSLDVKKLLEENNISLDEVLEWGKKRYPSYLGNLKALVALYLKQKGISVAGKNSARLSSVNIPVIRKFSEAKAGGRYQIRALLLEKVDEWSFKWCSKCKKVVKKSEDTCPICGSPTITRHGFKYLFADDEGTFEAVFYSDKEKDDLKEGDEYILQGRVHAGNDGNEFTIFEYKVADEREKEALKKLKTWFTINPRSKIADLQEFIKEEKIGMTVEEVSKKIGAKIQGDEIVLGDGK